MTTPIDKVNPDYGPSAEDIAKISAQALSVLSGLHGRTEVATLNAAARCVLRLTDGMLDGDLWAGVTATATEAIFEEMRSQALAPKDEEAPKGVSVDLSDAYDLVLETLGQKMPASMAFMAMQDFTTKATGARASSHEIVRNAMEFDAEVKRFADARGEIIDGCARHAHWAARKGT